MLKSKAAQTDEVDARTIDELFPLVYPWLRRRAEQCMKNEPRGHTLQATALVHEVYLKLANSPQAFQNEGHLYAVVTSVMRQILIDHARARATRKRGGGLVRVPLDNACRLADQQSALFLDVQEAVERLRERDSQRARMFELDFLTGLTHSEIAALLGIDIAKVKYGLSVARARLRQALSATESSTDHV